MPLRKKGFLLQNTEPGQVEWAAGVFFLLFFGVLLCSLLQVDLFRSSSQYLEDALALSNLASAVIDVEEYGISHKVKVADPRQAYERYKSAVQGNLNLDDSWECPRKAIISGPVQVVKYILYHVSGSQVEIFYFDENGLMTSWREVLGSCVAPDGNQIEATGVYSEISYQVEGLLGICTKAHKGKLVDIVGQGEIQEGEEEGDEGKEPEAARTGPDSIEEEATVSSMGTDLEQKGDGV